MQRILFKIEFEEVKKLSAETMAKIPASIFFSLSSDSLRDSFTKGDFLASKYILFSLCSHFAFYESHITNLEEKGEIQLEKIIPTLFHAFELPSGAISCFFLFM